MGIFSPLTNTFNIAVGASINPTHPIPQMHDASLAESSYAEWSAVTNLANLFPPTRVEVKFTGWGVVPNNQTVVFPKLRFKLDNISGTAADRSGRVTLSITVPGFGFGTTNFRWDGIDPPDGVQELTIENTILPTTILNNATFNANPLGIEIRAQFEFFQHQEDGNHFGSFQFLEIFIEEQFTASPSANDAELICEVW